MASCPHGLGPIQPIQPIPSGGHHQRGCSCVASSHEMTASRPLTCTSAKLLAYRRGMCSRPCVHVWCIWHVSSGETCTCGMAAYEAGFVEGMRSMRGMWTHCGVWDRGCRPSVISQRACVSRGVLNSMALQHCTALAMASHMTTSRIIAHHSQHHSRT